jgi:hypothetical protein
VQHSAAALHAEPNGLQGPASLEIDWHKPALQLLEQHSA